MQCKRQSVSIPPYKIKLHNEGHLSTKNYGFKCILIELQNHFKKGQITEIISLRNERWQVNVQIKLDMQDRATLRSQSFRITREHWCFADIIQPQIQHCYSLQSNSTTGMRRTTVLERINVALDLVQVDSMMFSPERQKLQKFIQIIAAYFTGINNEIIMALQQPHVRWIGL